MLVVDDNATTRRVICEQLATWGARTDEAGGGSGALELLRSAKSEEPYHLVVLDMEMPGMDGKQTALAIREIEALRTVPLLLLFPLGSRRAPEELSSVGFTFCLSKPVRGSQLHDTVIKALHLETASRPPTLRVA